jgi:hypothetical protein
VGFVPLIFVLFVPQILALSFFTRALRLTVTVVALMGIYLPFFNSSRGAISALVLATVATTVWYLLDNPFGIDNMYIALVAPAIVMVIERLIFPPPRDKQEHAAPELGQAARQQHWPWAHSNDKQHRATTIEDDKMSQSTPSAVGQVSQAAGDAARREAHLPAMTVQNHAANLIALSNGDLLCAWFGGTQEGIPDISIYLSRLAAGSEYLEQPVRLSEDASRSEQNPVLFEAPDGKLWLIYTAQLSGHQNTSIVRRRISGPGPQLGADRDPVRHPRHLRAPAHRGGCRRRLAVSGLHVPRGRG